MAGRPLAIQGGDPLGSPLGAGRTDAEVIEVRFQGPRLTLPTAMVGHRGLRFG